MSEVFRMIIEQLKSMDVKLSEVRETVSAVKALQEAGQKQTQELFDRVNTIEVSGCGKSGSHDAMEPRLRAVEGDMREVKTMSGLIAGLISSLGVGLSALVAWMKG